MGNDLDGLAAEDHVRVDHHDIDRPVEQRHVPASDALAVHAIAGALLVRGIAAPHALVVLCQGHWGIDLDLLGARLTCHGGAL